MRTNDEEPKGCTCMFGNASCPYCERTKNAAIEHDESAIPEMIARRIKQALETA